MEAEEGDGVDGQSVETNGRTGMVQSGPVKLSNPGQRSGFQIQRR
jgi:hypothetical protein